MIIQPAIAGAIVVIAVIIAAGALIILLGIRNKDKIGNKRLQGLILLVGGIVATIGSLTAILWILYMMSHR